MNTYFGLLAQFGAAEIQLSKVAEAFLNISPEEAKRRAARHKLPFVAYQAAPSQKSEWLVSADVLAEYLDGRKKVAGKEWQAMKKAESHLNQ